MTEAEWEALMDALEKGLQSRTDAETLAERNILKGSPGGVSPALQSKQAELEKLGAEVVSSATEFGEEAKGFV